MAALTDLQFNREGIIQNRITPCSLSPFTFILLIVGVPFRTTVLNAK
jgi:hypothetical protein